MEKYWVCAGCKSLFTDKSYSKPINFKMVNPDLTVDISICPDCLRKLKQYKTSIEIHRAKYPVLRLADYIIKKYYYIYSINNMRLNRLMFLFWVDYYKEYKQYLFDDFIIPTSIGPNLESVYYKYYGSGAMSIIPIFNINEESDIDYIFESKDIDFIDEEMTKYCKYEHYWEINKVAMSMANLDWSNNNITNYERVSFEEVIENLNTV